MIGFLRKIATTAPVDVVRHLPPGHRVYAIGDIHGRLDLFDDLLQQIEADDSARDDADLTIILLGDLVDRGPDSAGVIERVMELRRAGLPVRVLMGNHEQMMLAALDDEPDCLPQFLKVGGRATLRSYGMTDEEVDAFETAPSVDGARAAIGERHVAFLRDLESLIELGDYVFVHAGIRPGRPFTEQEDEDLFWIRRPFLDSTAEHGALVVHGHTPTDDIVIRPNRIGIDTGAYFSGQLTALGLEGTERWVLTTEGAPDASA